MRKIESEFLDEYKGLDKIFCDAFECKNGVSEYISRMEEASETYTALIDGWKDDYKLLKHLRWLRNKISHEAGDTECGKEDLDDLKAFKKRVIRGKDPLAELAKLKKKIAPKKGRSAVKSGPSAAKAGSAAAKKGAYLEREEGFGLGKALIWTAVIAVVIYAVYMFFGR
ncbi:MAG: hypothetical protein II971_07785 [Firmicutes bacterium]|nr:hypothetical protein [Bacillota bacterium]